MQGVFAMSVAFSAKLSMLRKEKDLTQRKAAADLSISQALLSHYENGIRECSLDFARKAARYYGVSADYLLGLTDERESADVLFRNEPEESDAAVSVKTLLRALYALSGAAQENGPQAEALFLDYFALCIKKYTNRLRLDSPYGDRLCELGTAILLSGGGGASLPAAGSSAALETMDKRAADLLSELIPAAL